MRIKSMRTKQNYTLMQFAKKTGIGKSTLNNIEEVLRGFCLNN